jgi:hypothetical protein
MYGKVGDRGSVIFVGCDGGAVVVLLVVLLLGIPPL